MYFEFSKNKNSPIVCNIPHAGVLVPEEFKTDFVIYNDELQEEVQYMADNYTDELYEDLITVSSYVKSAVSRLVVDIERFENEEDEPMSKVGMSAFYTKTSSGKTLRHISEQNKINIGKIYKEYHQSFTDLVSSSLDIHNKAIIVDCHSFASIPRVYEEDKEGSRPDICIGIDEFHTPMELVKILQDNFEEFGYSVKVNSPFSGSIVPLKFYKKDTRVITVMIEVNRKLYINEQTFQKNKDFSKTSKVISRTIITCLNQFLATNHTTRIPVISPKNHAIL